MLPPEFETEDTAGVSPRFCRRCGRAGRSSEILCAHCGETLEGQGYCGVCDRFWLLPAGEPCPKHDLPLEPDRPPPHPVLASGETVRWVTVARFDHPTSAVAPRLRLESEGIPTFLDGERVGHEAVYNVAVGGVRLQVPADLASDARILLDQNWQPVDPADDLDDAFDELAPEPGRRRRLVMKAIIVLVLFGPLIAALIRILLASIARLG